MNRICTLIYHRVVPAGSTPPDIFQIELQLPTFEAQIEDLVVRYGVLEPEAAIEGLLSGYSGRSQVLLTFDDGYRNSLQRVAPILRRLGVRAIAFISPNHVSNPARNYWWDMIAVAAGTGKLGGRPGTDDVARAQALRDRVKSLPYAEAHAVVSAAVGSIVPMPDEYAIASWVDLQAVSDVFLFANHGYSHDYLSALPLDLLDADFAAGEEWCEQSGCRMLPIIAYPFGDSACVTSSQIYSCVARRFTLGFMATKGISDGAGARDRYAIPRNFVVEGDLEAFRRRMTRLIQPPLPV